MKIVQLFIKVMNPSQMHQIKSQFHKNVSIIKIINYIK